VYNVARNLAVLEQVDAEAATPIGNSVSARYHRYFMNYIDNPEQSVQEITEAIGLDAASPYLYAARSVINIRLGNLEQARDDGKSAVALGAPGWTTPLQIEVQDLFFIQHNPSKALALINTFVDDDTEDWWQFTMRGIFYYLEGDYEAATADIETALALDPQANFAHAFAITLALREGDLLSVQMLIDEVLRLFPDPTFSERLLSAIYSEDVADSQFIDFTKASSNLLLRQWRSVIALSDKSLNAGLIVSELHFMRGFAYCNLGEDAAAEDAYTAAIELDPDFAILYTLRAEVRRNQGKALEALQDITALSQTAIVDNLTPYLPALTSGELNCTSIFNADLDALTDSTTDDN
ncbi:MAG: tetratricopeptide repeat protein, partial [Aggregatilineales bacterium]